MSTEKVKKTRNILFLGHQGSGKTSLVESLVSFINKTPKGSIERKTLLVTILTKKKIA